MLMRPQIIAEYTGPRCWPAALLAILVFFMSASPELLAQNNAPAPGSGEAPDLKFEVLEVTTGSGSKSQAQNKPPLTIEVLDVNTGSGSKANGPGGPAAAGPASPAAQSAGKGPAAAGADNDPAEGQHRVLFAALERWHYQTLASYNYDIPALADPFMPIQEVRGRPVTQSDLEAEAKLPPLLRLELNQLRLVAITSLSDRPGGGAWASFEDGAGNSYILRNGDRIGRNHGRITKIEPNEIWVEERGRSGQEPPRTTPMRLSTLDTKGLTRNEGDDSGALQTLSVPGE